MEYKDLLWGLNFDKDQDKEKKTKSKLDFGKKQKEFDLNQYFSKDKLFDLIKSDWISYLLITFSFILLLLSIFSINLWNRIEKIVIFDKNITILKGNIESQNRDIKYLNSLDFEEGDLFNNTKIVSYFLPKKDKYLDINETNKILRILESSWLKVKTISFSDSKLNDKDKDKFYDITKELWVENFTEDSSFLVYTITTNIDEEWLRRFYEKTDEMLNLIPSSMNIVPDPETGELSMSLVVNAVYINS